MTAESIQLGNMQETVQPWLRTVKHHDQEQLRTWRNAHASSFFHQSPITVDGQEQWFAGYCGRPDDFLFMVMAAEQAVGCIGIRFRSGAWDLYNVIRGVRPQGSAGFMAAGLAMVIAFARGFRPTAVWADVITGNPAVAWYLRNGFVIVAEDPQSHRMLWQGTVGKLAGETA